VLTTRFRSRAIKEDTRQEVRAKEELSRTLEADAQKLQKEIAVQEEDLQYLEKLGGFTSASVAGSTENGRLDSELILTLNYEFRLEYARDLPQPRFISGGLREGPKGGGAMGAIGGTGGMM
jgi:hypothetical protein